jgi:hypothetical protein
MKKLTIAGLLSLCAVGAYAQGTLVFNNNVAGSIVTHIYAPNPSNPSVETQGNGSTALTGDYPNGTTVYTGFTPIGGSSGAAGLPVNYAFGNNFTVQIFALGEDNPANDGSFNPLYHGVNTLFSSLQAVSQYTSTMATSAGVGAGFIQSVSPSGDAGIPNAGYNANNQNGASVDNVAALSLACWYNGGGTINSLSAASAAGVPYGWSKVFIANNLGEPASVMFAYNGTGASTPGNLKNLTSFSLVTPVPEPATIALGVMGACAFLARRKK